MNEKLKLAMQESLRLSKIFTALTNPWPFDKSKVTGWGDTFIRFKHEGEHLELSLKVFKARKKKVKK